MSYPQGAPTFEFRPTDPILTDESLFYYQAGTSIGAAFGGSTNGTNHWGTYEDTPGHGSFEPFTWTASAFHPPNIAYSHPQGIESIARPSQGSLDTPGQTQNPVQTEPQSLEDPAVSKFYSCNRCGKQYCRKSTLKAHVKHHLGERPFVCQICGKTFSQAANLTAHRRVHTGEKPFSCSICLRPFSQSSSLVTHKRTHTGERPYPCNHCEKAFTDSSTLTKHLRTHTGQKPYGCPLCMMKFSQSGNLHRHLKTHRAEAVSGKVR
ncbi:hypothetical protein FO519_008218 [Halicephalobus sp. NKZ332]|nr:hypothetical protein FO519_008218 [Halicephalobus sp. NKZ332]